MKIKYKKSHIMINIILSIVLIALIFNLILFQSTSFVLLDAILLSTFIIFVIILGYEKKKLRFTYETMFYIFSYSIVYLIITYVIGIFIGFNINIYRFNIATLIHSIIPYIILLLSGELLRYEITRKGDGSNLSYVLITLLLIIIDSTLFFKSFDLATGDGQIQYICYIVLASVSKNCFLLYISKIGGPYPTIIYRVIMDLKMFILPIFPDFGIYIESVLNVTFPVLLGLIIFKSLEQYKNKEVDARELKHNVVYGTISLSIISIFIGVVVILVSCKFKYGMLSIGSGSMTGTINKGDAVVYQVISKNYMPKKKDIIVFRKQGKIIVHRVIEVVKIDDKETIYYTKGDANNKPDGYPLTKNDIIGITKHRIRYIGLPSVALYELINRK